MATRHFSLTLTLTFTFTFTFIHSRGARGQKTQSDMSRYHPDLYRFIENTMNLFPLPPPVAALKV
jgi:hypothetical protein